MLEIALCWGIRSCLPLSDPEDGASPASPYLLLPGVIKFCVWGGKACQKLGKERAGPASPVPSLPGLDRHSCNSSRLYSLLAPW